MLNHAVSGRFNLDEKYNPLTKIGLIDLVHNAAQSKKKSVKAVTQRVAKPKLTAQNLAKRDIDIEYAPDHVAIADLDYPCNDKSTGEKDFSSWSYFRNHKIWKRVKPSLKL